LVGVDEEVAVLVIVGVDVFGAVEENLGLGVNVGVNVSAAVLVGVSVLWMLKLGEIIHSRPQAGMIVRMTSAGNRFLMWKNLSGEPFSGSLRGIIEQIIKVWWKNKWITQVHFLLRYLSSEGSLTGWLLWAGKIDCPIFLIWSCT
jgi:hypothetical protein